MYDSTSRYAGIETAHLTVLDAEGRPRQIAYTRRRFIPPLEDQVVLAEHRVAQPERLDTITARYLGDPTQFWRLCDANNAVRPDELTETVGRTILIARPGV